MSVFSPPKRLVRDLMSSFGYQITRKPGDSRRRTWGVQQSGHMTSYDIDGWFHDVYENAQAKTQMETSDNNLRRQRHYTLNYLLRNALARAEGDVCEVGCWRGLSTYQIAQQIKDSEKDLALHVFDSFEGLSEFLPEDASQDQRLDTKQVSSMLACPLPVVQENLREFDFIEYHPGWVPERFPEVASSTFAFVHIDLDLYQPIRDAFEFFHPLMSKNGIIVFDDYGFPTFPGAQQAVDEILGGLDNPMFMPLPSGQAFLVKS